MSNHLALAISTMTVTAAMPGEATTMAEGTESGGRWQVYNGGWMTCSQLKEGGVKESVNLLIDLDTLMIDGDRVHAMDEHSQWDICGHWQNIAKAGAVQADLVWYVPTDAEEEYEFFASRRLRGLAKRGSPLKASVGTNGGTWEVVAAGSTSEVNGRTHIAPANGLPCYIQRGATLGEISVVKWGASEDVGRIAASRFAALAAKPAAKPAVKEEEAATASETENESKTAAAETVEETSGDNPEPVAADDAGTVTNDDESAAAEDVAETTDDAEDMAEDVAETTDNAEDQAATIAALQAEVKELKASLDKAVAAGVELETRLDAVASAPPVLRTAGKGGAIVQAAATGAKPTSIIEARQKIQASHPKAGPMQIQRLTREAYPDLFN